MIGIRCVWPVMPGIIRLKRFIQKIKIHLFYILPRCPAINCQLEVEKMKELEQ